MKNLNIFKKYQALLLLAGIFCLFASSGKLSSDEGDNFFPSVVRDNAYFYIENFPLKNNSADPAIIKILSSPEFVELLDPLKKYIKGIDSLGAMMTGISPLNMIENSSKKIGFAVIRSDKNTPGILAWINLEGQAEAFRQNLPKLESYISTRISKQIETVRTKEYELKILPFGANKVAWLLMGENLVFGELSYIKAIAEGEIPAQESMLNSKEYLKSKDIMQIERGGTLAVINLLELFNRPNRPNRPMPNPFEIFGDISAEKLSLGFIPFKEGFKDVSISWMPEGENFFRKIFPPENASRKHAKYAPADSEYFLSGQMLLDNTFTESLKIMGRLKGLPGNRLKFIEKFEKYIKKIEAELQFDISEILATLGSENSLIISPSGSFYVIDIRSYPAFKAYMEQINVWLKEETPLKRIDYKGETINYYISQKYPLPMAISYTVIDESTLFVASSVQTIKKIISSLNNPDFASLEKNSDFIATTKQTRTGVVSAYYNLAPMIENVYGKSVPFMQMMSAIPFNPVDAGMMPGKTYFSEYLFGMAKSGWLIENGFVQEYYSPVGMGGDVVAILDLYGSALDSPAISAMIMAVATNRLAARKKLEQEGEEDE